MTDLRTAAYAAPQSVLVIPFADGIGDFVNMQPLLKAVARRFPQAEVSVAASAYANDLLAPDSRVKVVTPSWYNKEPGPLAQHFRHYISQKILAWLAGPMLKRELGGDIDLTINTFFLWERHMDFPRYWTPQTPPRPGALHTLDCLANILEEELDTVISQAERYPQLVIREEARRWAEDYFARYELGAAPVVAMVAESNMLIKKWSASQWAYLSDSLQARGYIPLFFAPPNSSLTNAIISRCQKPPLVVNTALDRVVALMELCQLCIGVDTGLLHIASAVGTSWLGLFGPTNPAVTGPYNQHIGRAIIAPFARGEGCRNCWKTFKYEDDQCRALETGSCTDYLDRRQVLEAAIDLLERQVVGR